MNSTVLAANCIFVRGANKHLIMDLQNNEWYHVQFSLSSSSHMESLPTQEELDFLIKRQILIRIPSELKDLFPPIDTSFDVPSIIEFGIIDRDASSTYSLIHTLNWFDSLLVKFCQIRYFDTVTVSELEFILKSIEESNLESIEFLTPHSDELEAYFKHIILLNPKINSVTLHGAGKTMNELHSSNRRLFLVEPILSANQCGIVHPSNFPRTKKHVLKSINYNSCLYKKIGIDVNGYIRNCPSAPQIIGHIDQLEQLTTAELETPLWHIKKDDVAVCKDCEFRYICTDCRIRTVDGEYSRPETCPYNPYTNKWRGQDGYEEPEKYRK